MFFKKTSLSLSFIIYFSIGLAYSDPIDASYTVELVQALFRHGARTPIKCEAQRLGTNESLYHPWGFAQLTNQGMTQEYQIGLMLRERYSNFLPDLYKPQDVYAYASGLGRTKASLELVLAALYPPTEELKWNKELNWMPIQIFSNPRPLDILIKSRNCPNFIKALEELFNTSEIKATIAEYDDMQKMLKNIFGNDFTFEEIFCTYNALAVHMNMKLPLPDWYTEDIHSKLKKAAYWYLETLSYNSKLKRLNGGPLVRRFAENLQNAELKNRKIYLYSAHDKTVHSFAKSNGLSLPYPDYGTTVILEKLSDRQNNPYVRFLLWTGEPKQLTTLKLPNCTEVCPLNEYLNAVEEVFPTDEEMLCLHENLQPKDIQNILTTDLMTIDD